MFLYQGIIPFVFTATFLVLGLLISWLINIKMDFAKARKFERIGNTVSMFGFIFGFQFRLSESLYGESRFRRTDSLPGVEAILLMLALYIPLHFLVTSYTQYRKDRANEQIVTIMIKEVISWFIILAVVLAFTIIVEFM